MAVQTLAPPPSDRTRVELRFSCRNLPAPSMFGEQKIQIQVRWCLKDSPKWHPAGATETISNQASPSFATAITLDYIFEKTQTLQIDCVDVGNNENKKIGSIEVTMGDIMGAKHAKLTRELVKPEGSGTGESSIMVSAEEIAATPQRLLNMSLRGEKLDKKDFFGKSDPLVEIYRHVHREGEDIAQTELLLVYRSEHIAQTLNPTWKPIRFETWADFDNSRITMSVWDWNSSGKFSFIGEVTITTAQLLEQNQFTLINEKKQKKKGSSYKGSGILHRDNIDLKRQYSFLGYLMGGLQINLVVGIDYTGSNGTPSRPGTLHHIGPNGSAYTRALASVASILLQYDSDGRVPLYGFGGLMPDRSTSHCFHVNNNPSDPNVLGLPGLIDAYTSSFSWVKLDGPTNFAPIIKKASKEALELVDAMDDILSYLILLIVTDGEICDMDETITEVISASSLPMSIIIVGLGNNDFTSMEELDSDDELLQDRRIAGRRAERDIVQFVHYDANAQDPVELAAQVLAEVPGQVAGYFNSRNIAPRNLV